MFVFYIKFIGLFSMQAISNISSRIEDYLSKNEERINGIKAIAGAIALYGIPIFLLYNYNTPLMEPNYQSENFSFKFSLDGGDILLGLTGSVAAIALYNIANFRLPL